MHVLAMQEINFFYFICLLYTAIYNFKTLAEHKPSLKLTKQIS